MNIKDTRCPECGHRLKLGGHPHKGQRVICSDCEKNLIIVNLNPIEVDVLMPKKLLNKTKKKARNIRVPCPECDELIILNTHSFLGYRLKCGNCTTLLEVVDTNPLELDVAFDTNKR
jgi:ssDNA-binding Zn-finger/Zn-ribbon topoisomerase 1